MPAPVTFVQSYLIRTEAELAELHVGLHSKFIHNVRMQIKYKTMPTVNRQLITVKQRHRHNTMQHLSTVPHPGGYWAIALRFNFHRY